MPLLWMQAMRLVFLPALLPAKPYAHDVIESSEGTTASQSTGTDNNSLQALAECIDRNHQCAYWSGIGECEANPRYMHVMCRSACRMCPGDDTRASKLYRSLELQYVHERQQPPPPMEELRELSYDPRVFVIDDFVTDEEAEVMMNYAKPLLKQARTINATTGLQQLDKARTNWQMYVNKTDNLEHPIFSKVVKRCHDLARIPLGHGEQIQVGRYNEGEFYEPHFDSEPNQGVRRSATVLIFLHGAEEGGETIFPKHLNCGHENFHGCCEDIPGKVLKQGKGLFIEGKKRQALLFYSHDLDGRNNIYSMHGSCPVVKGAKWIAQQWLREAPLESSPHYIPPESKHWFGR